MKMVRLGLGVGLISFCLGVVASFGIQPHENTSGYNALAPAFNGAEVYICKGPQSKRYHYRKDCQGLRRCSTDIYTIELSEAQRLGRTLCGFED